MFAVDLTSLENTWNFFSILEKDDMLWKCTLFTVEVIQHIASLGQYPYDSNLKNDLKQQASTFLLAKWAIQWRSTTPSGVFYRKAETSISKVIEVEISFLMKINAFHLISLVVYTDLENCKTTSPPALETKWYICPTYCNRWAFHIFWSCYL